MCDGCAKGYPRVLDLVAYSRLWCVSARSRSKYDPGLLHGASFLTELYFTVTLFTGCFLSCERLFTKYELFNVFLDECVHRHHV